MSLSTLLVLLNVLIFIFGVGITAYVYPYRSIPSSKWIILFSVALSLISFSVLNIYTNHDPESSKVFVRLRFVGLSLLAPIWFLFLHSVFPMWRTFRHKWLKWIVFIVPVITILIILSDHYSRLLIEEFTPIKIYGVNALRYKSGPWFMVHYAWSIGLMLLSFLLSIQAYLSSKSSLQKKQLIALNFGSLIAVLIDFYCVTTSSNLRWLMLSSGTFILSQIGVIYAIINNKLLNLSSIALGRIFESIADPILVLDENQNILKTNRSCRKLLTSDLDFANRNIKDVIPSLDLVPGEKRFFDRLGDERFFELSIENLEQNAQILFLREITDHKRLNYLLQQQSEFKTKLLAFISHDLSGHLESQLLATHTLSGEHSLGEMSFRKNLDLLKAATHSSQEFIQTVFSWLNGQNNKFTAQFKPFEWNTLIDETIEKLKPEFESKDIAVTFKRSGAHLIGEGDTTMIESIVKNILRNAIKATPIKKSITITLEKSGESFAEIAIQDEGSGLTEEQIQQLLAKNLDGLPFFRSDGMKGYGVGIGMCIINHFIELHHGIFNISSVPGAGSNFSIRMPLQKPSNEFS
ncbi:histidine kinase N-terminal 7TM domain-containing protein [Bdellovibrio sp.]|uniref:histidine kinase N-terminal 7TM domain-containing protein n=1 Tax=Bdellovibrio sp. TaxID=28201 RepID=UPI0039E67342